MICTAGANDQLTTDWVHSGPRRGGPHRGRRLTGVCAQVTCQGVSTAAGVVAQVTLEGLLSRVELDVAQQVALLGEGGSTLVALEGPLPCKGDTAKSRLLINSTLSYVIYI